MLKTINHHNSINTSIPSRFETIAAKYADRPAVQADKIILTYGDLNILANRIAHAISNDNASTKKAPVAVCMRPGLNLPAGILAVLKSGNCYVPIDPIHPAERNACIISDSGAAILLTDSRDLSAATEIASLKGRHLQIINADHVSTFPPHNPGGGERPLSPEEICAIIYTSGSTGQPKGVCHSHRNILHATDRYAELARIVPQDRMSHLHSTASIANATALFGSLLNGASLCPFRVSGKSALKIAEWLESENISILHTVPTLFRFICRGLRPEQRFHFIRLVRLGGEAITRNEWLYWKDHFQKDSGLYVGLGSTEAFNYFQTVYRQDEEINDNILPVGEPVPGMTSVLVGEDGKQCGINETGEIVLWSEYIFWGYRGQEDAAQKTLFKSRGPGRHRLFRTGDLARVDHNGRLFHVGRKDHQFKVLGNRIESAEIEQALRRIPPIREAAVVFHSSGTRENRIAAFLAIGSEDEPRRRNIRDALAALIPSYMIPSVFFFMTELPLLPGGKIDRVLLAEKVKARSASYCEGRNPMERTLVDSCQQILGIEPIGIFDDLFWDLGCDSLNAIEILHEIERIFHRRLPLSVFYESPTIEKIALHLQNDGWAPPESGMLSLHPEGSGIPLFSVCGVFGHALRLSIIGKMLGNEQPFYGLQPPDMDWEKHGCRTIPAMAEFYLKQIFRIQPKGPYQLFGFSFGGVIVFEIACQLQQAGHEVLLLSMLDTEPPDFMGAKHIDRMDRSLWMQVNETEDWLEQKGIHVAKAHRQALDVYLLNNIFYGTITYFWCKDTPVRNGLDRRREWERFATEGLRVVEIPGIHGHFHREPQLSAVTNGIRDCVRSNPPF